MRQKFARFDFLLENFYYLKNQLFRIFFFLIFRKNLLKKSKEKECVSLLKNRYFKYSYLFFTSVASNNFSYNEILIVKLSRPPYYARVISIKLFSSNKYVQGDYGGELVI